MAEQIDEYAGRGSTILEGVGSYSGEKKDVVMCACNNKQMYTIKRMVKEIDPKAFTIIMESNRKEIFTKTVWRENENRME